MIILLKLLVESIYDKCLTELKLAHLILYSNILKTLMKITLRKGSISINFHQEIFHPPRLLQPPLLFWT